MTWPDSGEPVTVDSQTFRPVWGELDLESVSVILSCMMHKVLRILNVLVSVQPPSLMKRKQLQPVKLQLAIRASIALGPFVTGSV